MIFGVFSGIFWAIDTIILSKVTLFALLLVALHDMFSCLFAGFFIKILNINITLNKRQIFTILLASSAGGFGMMSYLLSIHYSKASVAGILSSLYPIFSIIMAKILLKQTLGKTGLIGIFIAVVFTSLIFIFEINLKHINTLGICFGLICAALWGSESVIINIALKQGVDEKVALFIRQGISAMIAMFITIIYSLNGDIFSNTINIIPIITAAFFATISYFLYYKAIAKIGALKAMGLNISYSAWILIFSFLSGEKFSIFLFVCAMFIIFGSVLSNAKDQK